MVRQRNFASYQVVVESVRNWAKSTTIENMLNRKNGHSGWTILRGCRPSRVWVFSDTFYPAGRVKRKGSCCTTAVMPWFVWELKTAPGSTENEMVRARLQSKVQLTPAGSVLWLVAPQCFRVKGVYASVLGGPLLGRLGQTNPPIWPRSKAHVPLARGRKKDGPQNGQIGLMFALRNSGGNEVY